jgi:hypothetical protein
LIPRYAIEGIGKGQKNLKNSKAIFAKEILIPPVCPGVLGAPGILFLFREIRRGGIVDHPDLRGGNHF